ncbi:MAG: DoxX family protein [Verrucomicrobiaceae bacterium]|nr:DoxX family protein [Verrucomicrobiaceae bacterium]
MKSILQLSFLPLSPDLGLLLLRLTLGLAMFFNHGWPKLSGFTRNASNFPAVLVNGQVSLGLAVFAEVFCAALLVLGFFTRFAAAMLAITMGVAFFKIHRMAMQGDSSGELALLYLVGFGTLMLAGPGRFSADRS